jgi:hypothetical protein
MSNWIGTAFEAISFGDERLDSRFVKIAETFTGRKHDKEPGSIVNSGKESSQKFLKYRY